MWLMFLGCTFFGDGGGGIGMAEGQSSGVLRRELLFDHGRLLRLMLDISHRTLFLACNNRSDEYTIVFISPTSPYLSPLNRISPFNFQPPHI